MIAIPEESAAFNVQKFNKGPDVAQDGHAKDRENEVEVLMFMRCMSVHGSQVSSASVACCDACVCSEHGRVLCNQMGIDRS